MRAAAGRTLYFSSGSISTDAFSGNSPPPKSTQSVFSHTAEAREGSSRSTALVPNEVRAFSHPWRRLVVQLCSPPIHRPASSVLFRPLCGCTHSHFSSSMETRPFYVFLPLAPHTRTQVSLKDSALTRLCHSSSMLMHSVSVTTLELSTSLHSCLCFSQPRAWHSREQKHAQ